MYKVRLFLNLKDLPDKKRVTMTVIPEEEKNFSTEQSLVDEKKEQFLLLLVQKYIDSLIKIQIN